jgi:polar amino acid transport system substrate-binding protein
MVDSAAPAEGEPMRKQLVFAFLVALLALTASACGSDEETAATTAPVAGTETAAADPCAKDQLTLKTPGQLTIGTDNPAFPPWFQDAKGGPWNPTKEPTKMGYEAAVAFAVAEGLGFTDDEVKWTVVPFNNIFKPGPTDFDFDINQVSYSSKRDQAVDFSDSYYDVEQAVVVAKSSKFAKATSVADLKDAKLGAQIGTTSYDAILNTIKPSEQPNVYNTNDDAVNALKNGNIDGIVVDYPTSLYVTAVQAPNATAVGRLPSGGEEYLGLVLEEGNPLRDCVNQVIANLRSDGTLDQFAQEWIEGSAPPVLK